MCLSLLQMKKKVASQVPRLTIVGTQKELAWISLYVSGREVGIVNLVVELKRKGEVETKEVMCLRCDQSESSREREDVSDAENRG
jgi:hypothetical protein